MRYFKFPERKILLLLLLIAGSVWGFVAIADEMAEGGSGSFDSWALRAFRRPEDLSMPIGPAALLGIARDISALGGATVIVLVTVIVLGFLWLKGMGRSMVFLFAAVFGGSVLSSLLKYGFARVRPSVVPHLVEVSSLSFPSGHSMLSAVTYITLGVIVARMNQDRRVRIYALGVALLLTFFIGLSRVFLGVHYPTDVLAGWCAGMAWGTLCATVAKWLQEHGEIEPALP